MPLSKAQLKRSRQQERRVAQRLEAQQHGGSGSGAIKRNDAHTTEELVECKRTDNKAYIRIDLAELTALGTRADEQGRVPVLCIEIAGHEYVVLRDPDYQEMR